MTHLYGAPWNQKLIPLTAELKLKAVSFMDLLYERLGDLPGPRQLLDTLSTAEIAARKAEHVKYLLAVASPDLTEAEHRALATHMGNDRARVGLSTEDLVRGYDMLHALLHSQIDASGHAEALAMLARRMLHDLAWQMEAYAELQARRRAVLLHLTELLWTADSYTELIERAARMLSGHEEIVGCWVGRPDAQGRFRIECVAGRVIETYLVDLEQAKVTPTVLGNELQAQGPTGRAWRSGEIARCINFATDASMQLWQGPAARHGIRSGVAIPLGPPDASPVAILTLYSALPGGFTARDQTAFVHQLRMILDFALTRTEGREGRTHAIAYDVRRRWASQLRGGGLQMYYQPLMDLRSGRVTHVEALARLHDDGLMLMPAEFMPVLSSEDLLELYRHGLNQALVQRLEWLADGLELGVSVNVPSMALADRRYFEATRTALNDYGCDGSMLTLEILETDGIPAASDVGGELARFKSLGVSLAEDDLGSGHSSLSRLRNLPFDIVKIDRGIVTVDDRDSSTVLRFIYQLTRLGHSLGKLVVVEGVESADLLEAIRVLGADMVQGHVLALPMPAQQLARWISEHGSRWLPDARQPVSTLARLARLLVWEEHQQLLASSPLQDALAAGGTGAGLPPGLAG